MVEQSAERAIYMHSLWTTNLLWKSGVGNTTIFV